MGLDLLLSTFLLDLQWFQRSPHLKTGLLLSTMRELIGDRLLHDLYQVYIISAVNQERICIQLI
jgi:hypothetical protein